LGLSFFSHIQEVGNLEKRLARVEQSRELITFGVLLVAAVFLGVVLTQLLAILNNASDATRVAHDFHVLHLDWPDVLIVIFLTLFATWIIGIILTRVGQAMIWSSAQLRRLWHGHQGRKTRKVKP
jgi:hypothetical protein